MAPPLTSNPHRFHEDRSEIAQDLVEPAGALCPRRQHTRALKVEVSAERAGRTIIASQVINGKRVQVERRRPFAVFIG